jgi:hypothetical protein
VRRHVTLLLGLGAGRPLEALSSCGTGQSGATPTFCSDFCRVIVLHCSSVRVDRCAQIAVTPLVHQTVRWYTRKSGGTPKSPVNYSGAVPGKPEAEEFGVYDPWCTGHCSVVHRTLFGGAPDTVRWCTGQSGVPDQRTLRFPFCSCLLNSDLFFLLVCVEPLAPIECII